MNQQQLKELVALVGKQRERDCPEYYEMEPGDGGSCNERCRAGCGGTGKVTNKEAQDAWEVMTRPCHKHLRADCWYCISGDRRIPHDISTWPEVSINAMVMRAWGLWDGGGDNLSWLDSEPEALFTVFKEALAATAAQSSPA